MRQLMRHNILAIALGTLGLVMTTSLIAEPSSNVVWDAETRNLIKNADIEKGKQSAMACAGCHGVNNAAQIAPDVPVVYGQPAGATYKQLMDYKEQRRQHGIMQFYTTSLTKEDIANISVYYAGEALPVAKGEAESVTDGAIRMATRGDGERLIAPCAACHGDNGEGKEMDLPALAGQNPKYFELTMQAFKKGTRGNDLYSRMRYIAEALTDEEIKELADYYASLGTTPESQ